LLKPELVVVNIMEPRNLFRGIDSARLEIDSWDPEKVKYGL
jgi:hypothetical protein